MFILKSTHSQFIFNEIIVLIAAVIDVVDKIYYFPFEMCNLKWRIFFLDAIASSEMLRLVPSVRGMSGAAWNTKPMVESSYWSVEITFRIHGQGRFGGDGMAFWYTAFKGQKGPVFGSNDYWNGLGIFFDTYDNDGQASVNDNPYVMAVINDGTKSFDHANDGRSVARGGCQLNYRNRHGPTKAKIEYKQNKLIVGITDGLSFYSPYQDCIILDNVQLPPNGFFGLSAATGGVAGKMITMCSALLYLVWFLIQLKKYPRCCCCCCKKGDLPDAEREQLKAKFEDMKRQFEADKEQFQKEHPDEKPSESDDDEHFEQEEREDATERIVRQLFEGQAKVILAVTRFEQTLDSVAKRQEAIRSYLSSGGAVKPHATGDVAGGETFNRQEVMQVMDFVRSATAILREQQSVLQQIMSNVNSLEHKIRIACAQDNQPVANREPAHSTALEEIKRELEKIHLMQRTQQVNLPYDI
ncbi:putative legume lectins beta domain protein [Trichinella spiralis]|uniref:putative legume lectins beta domain protein n=1 Tax=Trichinella spiralis TaxID=6334 RepID=UPI0001EFE55F|nr:putative legume lectins beta domain protein [Trichinella spiralis]